MKWSKEGKKKGRRADCGAIFLVNHRNILESIRSNSHLTASFLIRSAQFSFSVTESDLEGRKGERGQTWRGSGERGGLSRREGKWSGVREEGKSKGRLMTA